VNNPIETLRWLTNKENGGVMLVTIAKYCNCHATSLGNILKGKYSATDKMMNSIRDGLQKYFNEFKEKMGE